MSVSTATSAVAQPTAGSSSPARPTKIQQRELAPAVFGRRNARSWTERLGRRFAARKLRLAKRCLQRGRPDRAVTILHPLMDGLPSIPAIRIWLARAALRSSNYEIVRKAVDPRRDIGSHEESLHYYRLARISRGLEDFDNAARYLRMAFDAGVKQERAWQEMGSLHLDKGDVDEAVNCFNQQASTANSAERSKRGLTAAATALSAAGRRDDAAAAYRGIIESAHDSEVPGHAYYGLVDADKTIDASHPVAATLRQLLHDPPRANVGQLHFALAIAHERSGNTAEAFSHYAVANTLSQAAFANQHWDPGAGLAASREVFTRPLVARLSQFGIADKFLICVVGMPRSGTTLMEQILSSHSQVRGLGERGDFAEAAHRLALRYDRKKGYPFCFKRLSPRAVTQQAAITRGDVLKHSDGRPFVATKLPGDVWRLGLIKILFPKVKILHMVRDPVDTCWSCFRQNFGAIGYATDLRWLAHEYRCYRQVVRHWHDVLPEWSILDVSYEALVSEPEATVRHVLDYCGLEYEDNCLEFHSKDGPVFTCSQYQVKEPIYKEAVGRSGLYREYLSAFLSGLDDDCADEKSGDGR